MQVIPKPFSKADLLRVIERAQPLDRLAAVVEARALECALSPTLGVLLRELVSNKQRTHEDTARALGMNTNTFRAHVRALLRRSGYRTVDDLVASLLREALALPLRR